MYRKNRLIALQLMFLVLESSAISNGYLADADQFPWHAKLLITTDIGSSFFCGGAILDPNWVITSARCVQKAQNISVTVGSIHYAITDSHRVTTDGVAVKLYPRWQNTSYHDDVALVQLRPSLTFNRYVRSIEIATKTPNIGSMVQVSGFGSVDESDYSPTNRLNYMTQRIISDSDCDLILKENVTGNGSVICATNTFEKQAICYGDDGGPLIDIAVNPPVLVGLGLVAVADSYVECDVSSPSLFTSVVEHQSWIRSVRSNSNNNTNFSVLIISLAFAITQKLSYSS